jgi:hypothetical protein
MKLRSCFLILLLTASCTASSALAKLRYEFPSTTFTTFQNRHPEIVRLALERQESGDVLLLDIVYAWTDLAHEMFAQTPQDVASTPQPERAVPYSINPYAYWESHPKALLAIFENWAAYLQPLQPEIQVEFAETFIEWLGIYTDNAYGFQISEILLDAYEIEDEDETGHNEEAFNEDSHWIPVTEDELLHLNQRMHAIASEIALLTPNEWAKTHGLLMQSVRSSRYILARAQKMHFSLKQILESLSALHTEVFGPTRFLESLWAPELDQIVDAFRYGSELLKEVDSPAFHLYMNYREHSKKKDLFKVTLRQLHERGYVPRYTMVEPAAQLAYLDQEHDVGRELLMLVKPKFGRNFILRGTLMEEHQDFIAVLPKNRPNLGQSSYVWIQHSHWTDYDGTWSDDISDPTVIEARLLHVFAHAPEEAESLDDMVLTSAQYSSSGVQEKHFHCDLIVQGSAFKIHP